jgi:cyclic patellamide precursor peptide PatG
VEQPEATETLAIPATGSDAPTSAAPGPKATADVLVPQACATCGAAPATNGAVAATPPAPSFVYAIGKIEPRFPRPDVEKEFAQAVGRAETVGLSDRQAVQDVLSQRQNRYLARQLCWVMTIEGLETYILIPRDPADLDLLVSALRPEPSPMDLDCVVGVRGPIAPAEMCNGLMVPIVLFDQIYSFDRDSLIKAIPRPEKITEKAFSPVAAELFDRIMQMTDNAGATDAHRALNYCALRYQAIYASAADAFAHDASLSAVDVQPSPLSGTRNIVEVIFSYTNRNTDVTEKFSVSVDVTGEFPYLVRRLSPYYDRY